MNRNMFFSCMVVLATSGLLVSAYLTYLSLVPPTSCGIDEFSVFSCDKVIWSKYSHIYGVSVALLGLVWFIIALGLIVLAWRDRRFVLGLLLWSLLGGAGVAGFVYTEVFLLRAICPWCTVAHVFGLSILALSIATLRAHNNTTGRPIESSS